MNKIELLVPLISLNFNSIFSQIASLQGTAINPINSYKPEYYTTSRTKITDNKETVFVASLFSYLTNK